VSILTRLKSGVYQDSVRLMRLSEELSQLSGVRRATVAMGTDANRRTLAEAEMLTGSIADAKADDLMIAVDATDDAMAEAALASAEEFLAQASRPSGTAGVGRPPGRSIKSAVEELGGAEVAVISVAGEFAALEAAHALESGLHVLLFSDNVSIEDERDLKLAAVRQRRLLMGPGAGTAILDGVALGFANRVRRGPIGVVAGSGTGLQEVTVLVHRGGSGISQAIGTGGRDLTEAVGGLTTRLGLELLAGDRETKVIVLLSKPPQRAVADQVLALARESGKPVVVGFLGGEPTTVRGDNLSFAGTLEEAALRALTALDGKTADPFAASPGVPEATAAAEAAQLAPEARFIRGLYSGGSLCDESLLILRASVPGPVRSNAGGDLSLRLADAWRSEGHTLVDLGEEEFTQGRPHPMIDPRVRLERLLTEAADAETAVILLDVVIGYGAHEDPAGALVPTVTQARKAAAAAGRYVAVVAHVCGTELDPQDLQRQEATLRSAGVLVAPTNAQAARLAGLIVAGRG
jgi:Succinyl-CoA synthetase, alpha subunit